MCVGVIEGSAFGFLGHVLPLHTPPPSRASRPVVAVLMTAERHKAVVKIPDRKEMMRTTGVSEEEVIARPWYGMICLDSCPDTSTGHHAMQANNVAVVCLTANQRDCTLAQRLAGSSRGAWGICEIP
jgi:hypothetical protein